MVLFCKSASQPPYQIRAGLQGLRAGLHLDGALRAVGGVLPLSSQGLGWICPAALGLVIGLIAHFAGRRKAA